LARVDEYLFFVFVGGAAPARVPDNLLFEVATSEKLPWLTLIRGGSQWRRQSRPNLCYPILVDRSTAAIVGFGEPFAGEDESERISSKGDLDYAWPVRSDGKLGIWRVNGEKLMSLVGSGFAYASKYDSKRGTWSVHYLQSGTVEGIASGSLDVARSAEDRFVELVRAPATSHVAKTVWSRPSHNAGRHGSELLRSLVPGRSFPFPKSLYAVEDALRIAVADKPRAVVLDFFGGSGTTSHAVARLNRQDGGERHSILVTNNEVSAAEAESLRKQGFRPGDPEWEALGIFEQVTRPRVSAAVTGMTPEGEPVKGDYKFTDEFPMAEGFEENVTLAELVYLDPDDVELDLAFAAVAPLLWLRAGAQGPVIDESLDSAGRRKPYTWTDRYGILFNPDRWRGFVKKLPDTATTAFVVTDSQAIFAGVAAELPDHLDVVRLYENYLTTFRINEGLG
jgi:adenine-specific DNA-methyltransferase